VFCTQCGQQNPDDSRFCARCGAAMNPSGGGDSPETTSTISLSALEGSLEGDAPAPAEPVGEEVGPLEGLPPGSALLVVKRGPNAGSRFLLDAAVTTAGRHPESDIFLDDVTVSRRHVEFRRVADGSFTVADVGSLNGTYVNRERIDQVPLSNGDEVQIGKYRLVFYASQRGI